MVGSPKFSIITPSFKQASFIDETHKSVQDQRLGDFEHLIYDPGSTDGSLEIIHAYCEASNRAELILGQDKSQTNAINLGFSRARGEILCWLNSDDAYFGDDVLEAVGRVFEQHPEIDIVYGRGQFVAPDGEKLKEAYINRDGANILEQMSQSLGVLQPSLFMRRRIFEMAGSLDEGMNFSFDYEYWVRCANYGAKFHFLDKLLSRAVIHEDAKTMRARGTSLAEAAKVAERYYEFVSIDWASRIADHEVNQNDGIIAHAANEASVIKHTKEVFRRFNKNVLALSRYFNADPLMADNTKAAFAELVGEVTSRAYLSGWDENYFDMGITLIASIHRNDPEAQIFVYDLGMTPAQRAFLKLLEGVIFLNAEFVPFSHDWQKHPKNYVFKIALFSHLFKWLPTDCALLWVDAGVMLMKEPEAIFSQLRQDGVFFIDHDDSRHWPLYNASFTSDAAITAGKFTWSELAGPHVCSCLFGGVVGAVAASVFIEAAEMASIHAIAVGDKHPPESDKRKSLSGDEQHEHATAFSARNQPVNDLEALRRVFGYYGHRQDQSIVSLLATRHGLPISSAAKFCPANDESSVISKENWFEGVSSKLGDYRAVREDQPGVTFHHRGLVKEFSGLRFAFERQSIVGVLGNGPSLAEVDLPNLAGVDSIGMNAAYRFWEEISWFPAFYCCLDTVVGMSHKVAIRDLVRSRRRLGVKAFMLRKNLVDWLAETGDLDGVIDFDLVRFGVRQLLAEPVTTGSHALAWGNWMGYQNGVVAGVDCNYVEQVQGASLTEEGTLVIQEGAENPNYFFESYQQVGDVYNIPNPSRDLHIRSWRNVSALLSKGAATYNISTNSRMDAFPIVTLNEALARFEYPPLLGRLMIDCDNSALLLTACATQLLLEPKRTLAMLSADSKLTVAVDKAIQSLPATQGTVEHYKRVEEFARQNCPNN